MDADKLEAEIQKLCDDAEVNGLSICDIADALDLVFSRFNRRLSNAWLRAFEDKIKNQS